MIDDLAELVRIDTQNPGATEQACSDWVEDRLRAAGAEVVRYAVADGRDNVVARVEGRAGGPTLVLLAHMDTVPVGEGWTVDALSGHVAQGRVWGRGAVDMKARLAIGVHAFCDVMRAAPPSGTIVFCATADEEGPGMLGAHGLVEQGVVGRDDQVIALEPTNLRLRLGHVGLQWMRLTVHGRMGHAGRTELGLDANHVAALVVAAVKEAITSREESDPLLGSPQCTCSRLTGGTATNVIPGSCTLEFDVRLVPPMTPRSTLELVRSVVDGVVAGFPGASYTLEPLGISRPPVVASLDSPVVERLRETYRARDGEELRWGGDDGHYAYTDAAMVAALTGSTSCVAWGPGSPDDSHVADESVVIAEVERGHDLLRDLVRAW